MAIKIVLDEYWIMVYDKLMKIKNILKLFTVIFTAKVLCGIHDSLITPNEKLGRLDNILNFYKYSDEEKQKILQEALGYFGLSTFENPTLLLLEKRNQDGAQQSQMDKKFGSNIPLYYETLKTCLIPSVDPLCKLPVTLYCMMATNLSFVQGQNNCVYWPVVRQNGQVFMSALSNIKFKHETNVDVDGIKTITASTHDLNGAELANISIEVDQYGVTQGLAKLVWVRDWVTQAGVEYFRSGGMDGRIFEGQIMIDNHIQYNKSIEDSLNQKLIDQDPLGFISVNDNLFPTLHTLAHMLLVFTIACKSELGDEPHEIVENEIFASRGDIGPKLYKHQFLGGSFFIPFTPLFRTQSSSAN